MTAPTTVHRLNGVTHDFGAFNREFATHGEVMKGANGGGLDNVETGQVATGVAAIANSHPRTVSGRSERSAVIPCGARFDP